MPDTPNNGKNELTFAQRVGKKVRNTAIAVTLGAGAGGYLGGKEGAELGTAGALTLGAASAIVQRDKKTALALSAAAGVAGSAWVAPDGHEFDNLKESAAVGVGLGVAAMMARERKPGTGERETLADSAKHRSWIEREHEINSRGPGKDPRFP
jgi:hypothetical protein